MEGGTQQKRKTSLEREDPRTMRRNTNFCLGQELAYRTQQRIVRGATLDFYRPEDRSRVSGACSRLLRSERCRSRGGLYRYIPGVLHSEGKLIQEGEQTEQVPIARPYRASCPVGPVMSCSVSVLPVYQQRFLLHRSL